MLCLALELLFPRLNCHRVVPIYTQVDTRAGLQNPEAGSYKCPARFLLSLTYNTNYTSMAVYYYGPLIRHWALDL